LLVASLGIATATFGAGCRNSVVANFPATCTSCGVDDGGEGDARPTGSPDASKDAAVTSADATVE
jgi:hypothetical protein